MCVFAFIRHSSNKRLPLVVP